MAGSACLGVVVERARAGCGPRERTAIHNGSRTLAAPSSATPPGRVTGVDLRASWVTDTDLRKLLQFPNLSYLDLSLTRITDQGMLELKNAPGIVDLNLYYAEYVTDEGLAAIKDWKKLKRLNVHGTKISDTTLEHISASPRSSP